MALRYALLGLISEKPRYGYEIKKEFEKIIRPFTLTPLISSIF